MERQLTIQSQQSNGIIKIETKTESMDKILAYDNSTVSTVLVLQSGDRLGRESSRKLVVFDELSTKHPPLFGTDDSWDVRL